MNKRTIFVDWGWLMFRAIFATHGDKNGVPATYSTMNMLVSNLRVLGVRKTDRVIIAVDGTRKGNWRKDIDPQYKANRKDQRDKFDIDWSYWFDEYRKLLEKLDRATPFHIVEAEKLEADDIIAYGCRYYKNDECVIVSSDSDYEQLAAFPNVKVYSPKSKNFKYIENPYKVIADKIKKERTDNLLSPVLNERDFDKRNILVNLTTLPAFVEEKAKEQLDKVNDFKQYDETLVPFKKIKERYFEMWNKQPSMLVDVAIKTVPKPKRAKKQKPSFTPPLF